MNTTPATFTTTDQNTGREVTWNVQVDRQTEASAPVWTNNVMVTRPNGRSVFQMFVRVEDGQVVRHSSPRKAW
jgi:hypothetical protein